MNNNIYKREKILKIKTFVTLALLILITIFSNSCMDTFGTDPFVKKVPVDPKDTSNSDTKIRAKEINWRFREVVGANQINEWPNSITFLNNYALIDTSNGKTFVWIELEIKANFNFKNMDNENPERSERVEYVKIKIDSLEVQPNISYLLNDLNAGRYGKIEIFSYIDGKKYSFEGKDLITRIRFEYLREQHKITGSFTFDFQMISYVKILQFIGNFSIFY